MSELGFLMKEVDTRCSRLMRKDEALRFKLRAKGEINAELRRELEAEAKRKGIIEAEVRTREKMKEEALEGDTMRRKEAEARLGVATEALEWGYDEA